MNKNINLSTSLVDLDNITSKVPISNFSADEIENMAKLIIAAGGVIRPIILKRKGLESCEVVAGDFEYYATVKASEIDPDHSGMVRAFIIGEAQEENVKKQQEILKSLKASVAEYSTVTAPTKTPNFEVMEDKASLTEMFNHLTSSLTAGFHNLLDQKLQPITTKLDKLATAPPTSPTQVITAHAQTEMWHNFTEILNNLLDQRLQPITTKLDELATASPTSPTQVITANSQTEIFNNLLDQKLQPITAKLDELATATPTSPTQVVTSQVEAEEILKPLEYLLLESEKLSDESREKLLTKIQKQLRKAQLSLESQLKKLKQDYQNMTVSQLKEMAKERDIKITSRMRKKEIIAALKKADASN